MTVKIIWCNGTGNSITGRQGDKDNIKDEEERSKFAT